eukprot:PITA_18642
MIMQLDLAKAYDKMNWTYIRKVLLAYRFDHNWVRWVMALVTSSSFSILVNASPSKNFTPSRGLMQGDPLSPFLFILMMEGLSHSIMHAKEVGNIKGLQLSKTSQALTHEQFVDDTMLQGIPTVKEALAYKKILSDFVMATDMERLQISIAAVAETADSVAETADSVAETADPVAETAVKHANSVGRNLRFWKSFLKNSGSNDPEVLSKVLGAKLWWRWVKYPKAEWAHIWKEKYTSNWQDNDHKRMIGIIKGSYIWNKAWENKGLVQNNSFWEIREGDIALFSEDKWQQ